MYTLPKNFIVALIAPVNKLEARFALHLMRQTNDPIKGLVGTRVMLGDPMAIMLLRQALVYEHLAAVADSVVKNTADPSSPVFAVIANALMCVQNDLTRAASAFALAASAKDAPAIDTIAIPALVPDIMALDILDDLQATVWSAEGVLRGGGGRRGPSGKRREGPLNVDDLVNALVTAVFPPMPAYGRKSRTATPRAAGPLDAATLSGEGAGPETPADVLTRADHAATVDMLAQRRQPPADPVDALTAAFLDRAENRAAGLCDCPDCVQWRKNSVAIPPEKDARDPEHMNDPHLKAD